MTELTREDVEELRAWLVNLTGGDALCTLALYALEIKEKLANGYKLVEFVELPPAVIPLDDDLSSLPEPKA